MFQGEIHIENGKISYIKQSIGRLVLVINGKKIDLGNSFAYPGFVDSHIHLLGTGESLSMPNLSVCKSSLECLYKLKEQTPKRGEWVFARGWNNENWLDSSLPTKEVIDTLFPTEPVYIVRIDGHCAWVNSKALELCNITQETVEPQGGKILKDTNGVPNGILLDNAMDLVYQHIPEYTDAQLLSFLKEGIAFLTSLGLTEVHDMDVPIELLPIYLNYFETNAPKVEIKLFVNGQKGISVNEIQLKGKHPFVEIAGIKLYMDGALGSYGAWLWQPYSDNPNTNGFSLLRKDELIEKINIANKLNLGLVIHCIGDRATSEVLNTYEKYIQLHGGKLPFLRIEHSQIVPIEDVKRYHRLGVACSVQPYHFISDYKMAAERLGERTKDAYRWKSFLSNAVILCSGSDYPVDSANPFLGIDAMVNRQRYDYLRLFSDEALDIKDAIKTYTINPHLSINKEYNKLNIGYPADITVLDRDLINTPLELIKETQVIATVCNGEVIYLNE
jgi:predicted amidohydrolase YtcJ